MNLTRLKNFLLVSFPVLCAGLTLVLQLSLAHRYSTGGEEVTGLAAEARVLERENDYLRNRIAAVSSLAVVRRRALADGFVAGQVEFLLPPALASR